MNKGFIVKSAIALATLVVMVIIGKSLIDVHAVPSFSEYIANSTASSTSGTDLATSTADNMLKTMDISAPNGVIHTMIADTPATEEKGLGNRDSLPSDSGMIFVFSQPGTYAFWMKDMHFPLDMVWINADKQVVGISDNISPDTYPNVFVPPSAISYVLELNAGAASRFGIATGTMMTFSLVR